MHWSSLNEGLLVYLLALGSPARALPASAWYAVGRPVGTYEGFEFLTEHGFQSIFRWQYPALFYDYRGRRDKLTTSEALQLFAETLLAERQLVFEAAANPRTAAAIPERTDDRYRPVNGHAGQLHPALQGIPEDIWFLGPAAETRAAAGRQLRIAKQGVRELRRPWGW